MSVPFFTQFSVSNGTFTAFIAPAGVLTKAPGLIMKREPGLILYMCGNYPVILPDLSQFPDRFLVRRALTAFQILTILDEAYQSYLIFEFDRSLFEECTDLLPVIGHRCREYAMNNAGVLLLSTYPDTYIQALEPFFHRIFLMQQIEAGSKPVKKKATSKQLSLDSLGV
ncbi:MAG: hypothetical protein GX268_12280 [Methanomicrobiales archaeon]|jgi:hypothetical protein|nr:hypothetical protein [Methanomicrobiales archaeon]